MSDSKQCDAALQNLLNQDRQFISLVHGIIRRLFFSPQLCGQSWFVCMKCLSLPFARQQCQGRCHVLLIDIVHTVLGSIVADPPAFFEAHCFSLMVPLWTVPCVVIDHYLWLCWCLLSDLAHARTFAYVLHCSTCRCCGWLAAFVLVNQGVYLETICVYVMRISRLTVVASTLFSIVRPIHSSNYHTWQKMICWPPSFS